MSRAVAGCARLKIGALIAVLWLLCGAFCAAATIVPGLYSGTIQNGNSGASPITLRIIQGCGALVDLPAENIYGFPVSSIKIDRQKIDFTLGVENGALHFSGRLDGADKNARITGHYSGSSASGDFVLSPREESPEELVGIPLSLRAPGGYIRGNLLMPEGKTPCPLVIIVGGAGTTDRDGNNYNVPGKCNALKDLALGLSRLGIASYRYDKRGAGQCYMRAKSEELTRFNDYIADAKSVFESFTSDSRFSRIIMLGHNEGALVAIAAANEEQQRKRTVPDSIIMVCASGKSALQIVTETLSAVPAENKKEADDIMNSLEKGRIYPHPSAYFADFFRPSYQPYLMSWFRYDIKKELEKWQGPVLLVQGDRDFQVTMREFQLLAEASPKSPALVVAEMNHELKKVPADLDENYKAFSDPSYPLAPGLAESIAAFIGGGAYPSTVKRVDTGN